MRSTKSCFGPPVARLRHLSSVRGLLYGNSPLGECSDPISVRCLAFVSPVVKDNEVERVWKISSDKSLLGIEQYANDKIHIKNHEPRYLTCSGSGTEETRPSKGSK